MYVCWLSPMWRWGWQQQAGGLDICLLAMPLKTHFCVLVMYESLFLVFFCFFFFPFSEVYLQFDCSN